MVRAVVLDILLLIGLSLTAAALRPFFPQGISWTGKWRMMAQPEDPSFVSLQNAIELNEKGSSVFIDARSSIEYEEGHIPGARSLPYYEMENRLESALAGLEPATPLVVYCEGVGCELSFFLGRELMVMGYQNVKIFYGGYPEWQQAGLPTE
jgi:rhodanese-related sulfurtransferase